MKKIGRFIGKSILGGFFFYFGIVLAYATGNLINTIKNQTINQGDYIASGWFQSVNDKLINISIYDGNGISSESIRGAEKICIGNNCKNQWPEEDLLWLTGSNKIYYEGGNVGIGTETPTTQLEVNGDIKIPYENGTKGLIFGYHPDKKYLTSNKDGTLQRRTNSAALGKSFEIYDKNDSKVEVKLNAGGNSFLRTGNLGIGTTKPGRRLDINGRMRLRNGGRILELFVWENSDCNHEGESLGCNGNRCLCIKKIQ